MKQPKLRGILFVFLTLCITQIRGWITPTRRTRNCSRRLRSTSSNSEHINNLLKLLSPSDKCQVDQMSSTDLAYVGDAVYELLIRTTKVWPSKRTSDLQDEVVSIVRGMFREHCAHLQHFTQIISFG